MITRIISGQKGADGAALDFARKYRISVETGYPTCARREHSNPGR